MTAPELRPSASVPPRVFDVIVAAIEKVVINEAEAHGLAPLPREAIVRIRERCQDAARAVIDVAAPRGSLTPSTPMSPVAACRTGGKDQPHERHDDPRCPRLVLRPLSRRVR